MTNLPPAHRVLCVGLLLAAPGCRAPDAGSGNGPDSPTPSEQLPPEGTTSGECDDGLDNDIDGLTDCDDEDCADLAECLPAAVSSFAAEVPAFPVDGAAGMTIEAWVHLDEPDHYGHVLRTWVAATCPRQSFTLSSPTPVDGAWLHGDPSAPLAVHPLPLESWVHVAAVQSSSGSVLYVDGEEVGTASELVEGSYDCDGGAVSADASMRFGSWRLSAGRIYTEEFIPPAELVAEDSTRALYSFDDHSDPGRGTSGNDRHLVFSVGPTVTVEP
jgi:hypothetical protein